MTTANPYAVAGGAAAVTATSTGQLTPPAPAGQGGYNFATVSNASPWLCTVVGAAGTSTLQPFTADVIPVSLGQLLSYTMSIPPGGSGTTISAQPTYIQADWFAAGNAPPAGTYPISLTAQAILASVSGPATQSAGGGAAFTTTGLGPFAFGASLPALTAKWAMMSAAISAATVTTTGVMNLIELATGLKMEIPFPAIFTSFAETLTIAFPAGGLAVPPGGFTLQAVFSSTGGALAAVTGYASALIGY
jgi:hypothetical protein